MRPIRALTPLILVGLLAACGEKPKTPTTPAPGLPAGKLRQVASGVSESRFLGLDDLRKGEGVVQATVLVVGATSTSAGGKYALVVKREIIDCSVNRTTEEVVSYFDAAGQRVGSEAVDTGRMGRPMEVAETEGPAACGQGPKRGAVVAGWKAAQRSVQAPPEDLAKTAKPDDFEAQAWLCASGLRRRLDWLSLPACDRALKLNPDDLSVRLDHGYMSLIDRNAVAAEADFSKIIGADPDNAQALFGRSLALALRGKLAAGRPDHDKAIAQEPKLGAWVQATYSLYVTDPYK